MKNLKSDIHGHLEYLIQNCATAFEELRRLNSELLKLFISDEEAEDINRIGALHRMVQDYLIVRVAGLFDAESYTVSFDIIFREDENYKRIKKEDIIQYIVRLRHTFVAHRHKKLVDGLPETGKILESNLLDLLKELEALLTI